MAGTTLFNFGVSFELVTGTSAGLLSLLSWEIFRRSPLGRAILVLSLATAVFTLNHVLLLVFESNTTVLRMLESVVYTGLAVFVGFMVLSQRRVRRDAQEMQR